jgi:hypothetical protein
VRTFYRVLDSFEPAGTFGFENGVENWIAPEKAFKLSKVDTTTERVHAGASALRLTTVLIGNGNDSFPGQEYYTHSEAMVYFDQPIPGLSMPGPYDLTGKPVSCFVYLPSMLKAGNTPQAFIRMFAKDRKFANDYGPIVYIDSSHVEQWVVKYPENWFSRTCRAQLCDARRSRLYHRC